MSPLLRVVTLAGASCFCAVSHAGCSNSKTSPPPIGSTATVASASPPTAPEPSAAPVAQPASLRKRKDPAACSKSGPIVFDDATTETAVRRQLRKPEGPISPAELRKIKTFDTSQASRNDELDPCVVPYLTGVHGLYLAPGDLDDISLLKGLRSVESLRLAATKVRDISALSGMTKLDRLDLGRTPVQDLTPLAGLKSLTELELDDTEVSDLTPLAKLTNLEIVLIKHTRVSDISPLKDLHKLKHLYIEGSLVRDISPLSALTTLKIHQ